MIFHSIHIHFPPHLVEVEFAVSPGGHFDVMPGGLVSLDITLCTTTLG